MTIEQEIKAEEARVRIAHGNTLKARERRARIEEGIDLEAYRARVKEYRATHDLPDPSTLKIPRYTEPPSVNYGMLYGFVRGFFERNKDKIPKPSNLKGKPDMKTLKWIYHNVILGMYGVKESQIIGSKQV